MQVQTPADKLYFTTVRLEGRFGFTTTKATGFIYSVPVERINDPSIQGTTLFLVTNRHVVDKAKDSLVMSMLKASGDGTPALGEPVTATLEKCDGSWTRHPDSLVDVAVFPFNQIQNALAEQGSQPFFLSVPSNLSASGKDARELLNSVEEILFVGYPNALFDKKNLTPIVRRGTTATPPELDYCGHPAFLIDASVFPGSSGSPVFVLDRGTWQARDGTVNVGQRFLFLGIISKTHIRKVEGEIEELATDLAEGRQGVRLEDPLNLGIVYKASAVDECADQVIMSSGFRRQTQGDPAKGGDTAASAAA
jgi:trypsin-like peptidase